MQKYIRSVAIQQWVLLPLRLFLGVTFVYAGIQKIMDPQFFQASAPGYIGRQIARFAVGSPIHALLTSLAEPHAKFFGLIIIFGEIAIGLGTLFGFLFRPAAFFGALLSILFFLSASWHVYPYFYGADIVFTFAWLTLMLNGPVGTGLPSFDELLSLRLLQATPVRYQPQVAPLLSIVLGTLDRREPALTTPTTVGSVPQRLPQGQQSSYKLLMQQRATQQVTRRSFLWGALTGGATTLGIFAISYALRIFSSNSADTTATGTGTSGTVGATATPEATATGTVTGSTQTGGQIARASAVPQNSAVSFTIPSSGDPGVLVHLNNGQFVAYDALCTHAGCQVDYDSNSQLLQCPCHGAAFDPAKNAEVVSPPAPSPLTPVKISVDSATGAITLSS